MAFIMSSILSLFVFLGHRASCAPSRSFSNQAGNSLCKNVDREADKPAFDKSGNVNTCRIFRGDFDTELKMSVFLNRTEIQWQGRSAASVSALAYQIRAGCEARPLRCTFLYVFSLTISRSVLCFAHVRMTIGGTV